MLTLPLIRKLVETGLIKENTEIEAHYMGVDLSGKPLSRVSGSFCVRTVKINEAANIGIFTVVSTIDGTPKTIRSDDVFSIDGMPIARLASVYGIDKSGGKIKEGKRRGRKPKVKENQAT